MVRNVRNTAERDFLPARQYTQYKVGIFIKNNQSLCNKNTVQAVMVATTRLTIINLTFPPDSSWLVGGRVQWRGINNVCSIQHFENLIYT